MLFADRRFQSISYDSLPQGTSARSVAFLAATSTAAVPRSNTHPTFLNARHFYQTLLITTITLKPIMHLFILATMAYTVLCSKINIG